MEFHDSRGKGSRRISTVSCACPRATPGRMQREILNVAKCECSIDALALKSLECRWKNLHNQLKQIHYNRSRIKESLLWFTSDCRQVYAVIKVYRNLWRDTIRRITRADGDKWCQSRINNVAIFRVKIHAIIKGWAFKDSQRIAR